MLLRQALGFQDQTDKGVQMRARMLMESGCGDMDGVWMDPVMAQVMMTFDFARMEPPLSGLHPSQAA